MWNMVPFDNMLVMGEFKSADLPDVVKKDWPIQPDREYTLVVPDFLAINQESTMGARGLEFPISTGKFQRDAPIEWVKKQKKLP